MDPFSWLLLLQLVIAAPDDALVARRLDRADELAAVFETARAAAAYEDALDLDPANPEALIGACRAYNDLGREAKGDDAVVYLETALRLARRLQQQFPDQPEGHFWVAATSGNLTAHRPAGEKLRLSREVEKNARQAIAVDPCFAPAWAALGIYDREVASLPWFVRAVAGGFMGGLPGGSFEESARKLEKAVALDPESVFDHYQLALTYEKLDRHVEAAEQFRVAIVSSPTEAQEPALQADARDRLARLVAAPRPRR